MSVLTEIVRQRHDWATSGQMIARRNRKLKVTLDYLLIGTCAIVVYFYHESILAFVSGIVG